MWFAAVVLFAVLAAGIIVYRAANDDVRTAANDILPPVYQHMQTERQREAAEFGA